MHIGQGCPPPRFVVIHACAIVQQVQTMHGIMLLAVEFVWLEIYCCCTQCDECKERCEDMFEKRDWHATKNQRLKCYKNGILYYCILFICLKEGQCVIICGAVSNMRFLQSSLKISGAPYFFIYATCKRYNEYAASSLSDNRG